MTHFMVGHIEIMKKSNSTSSHFYALRYWPTHVMFFMIRMIAWLPYPILFHLGNFLGWCMFHTAKHRVDIARKNIQLCFPRLNTQQQETLVANNLKSTGIGMLETAMLWFGPQRRWQHLFEIDGLEHYQAAKEQGKGGLLLSFHLTSLEVGGSLLGTQIPFAALYRKNQNQLIEHAMTQGRKRFVHPIERESTREMIRWIKDNGFVWYAADQDYGRQQSIFVPFFNIPTATITATTRFVKLTKAPVIPMTQRRDAKRKKIIITLHPPINNIGKNDIQDAEIINGFLENYLTQYPSDYLWIHRRFKTRPEEHMPSLYSKKKMRRPLTLRAYNSLLSTADSIDYKEGLPFKITTSSCIIYCLYRKHLWHHIFPPYKNFIRSLKTENLNGNQIKFQGSVRFCEEKSCDLIYLEPK